MTITDETTSEPELSIEQIAAAARVQNLRFTAQELAQMRDALSRRRAHYQDLRAESLPNSLAPALLFDPRTSKPAGQIDRQRIMPSPAPDTALPEAPSDIAFASIGTLGRLLRGGQLSAVALTRLYLDRLRQFDHLLNCVVSYTEARALAQAQRADAELAQGIDRGPLHGIPWGVKDLLAVKGTRTTWGAMPYKDQVIDTDATVVKRLDAAGAVLIAKLTTGALANGDVWFDGTTKNPWDLNQGSSGSSAGPAAATAAGLVGFAIGSETFGSIVSPSSRCGVTGLRPTFGRVSRHGAMALSWSMDKLGPIARTAEDCALVFNAIYGSDDQDLAVLDAPFGWEPAVDLRSLRIGYVAAAFAEEGPRQAYDQAALDTLRALGANLIPIELPVFAVETLLLILQAEAAAAFEALTYSDRDDLLVRQDDSAWPTIFRQAHLIPAVTYIRANRLRRRLMDDMAAVMDAVDLYVAPSFSGTLPVTNLTGHPAVVVPAGFDEAGVPRSSITFTGRLFEEATILAAAFQFQQATDFHTRRPPLTAPAA